MPRGSVAWWPDNLSVFMQVPVQIHVVDNIPKSAAQKVQRFHLAEQFGQKPGKENSRPLASLNIKEEVLQAWEQELGSRPANTDNFFGSGGGSMQAATLASSLSSRLGVSVNSALVFSYPEPARLAATLQEQISQIESKVSPSDMPWRLLC